MENGPVHTHVGMIFIGANVNFNGFNLSKDVPIATSVYSFKHHLDLAWENNSLKNHLI